MATIKITLDKRANCTTVEGKYPLVMRIGHKRKTRDVGLNIHLHEKQFNEATRGIKGIINSVRHTKRLQKLFAEIDLWLDENKSQIKLWPIQQLKSEIERRFFKRQTTLSLLDHGCKVLHRFTVEGRFSTAESYEDALKIFMKYQLKLAGKNDRVMIKTLFKKEKEGFSILEEYQPFDIPIKAITVEFVKDLRTYLVNRVNSKNSVGIYLRSLQSILNDAEKSYSELRGHKPFAGIKKTSYKNAPVVLSPEEINRIRELKFEEGSSKFHVKNYFLFMFNNMGMNFYDIALAKVSQFDGERISYSRKKTEREGDFFSIQQTPEALQIINYYIAGKEVDDYLFPLIPKDTPAPRIFRVKKDRAGWFNKHMKQIAEMTEIDKKITTYTARDTWTNIGLNLGIDIRKISTGLGHSSVQVTEKHYSQIIQEKILDEINASITGQ